MTSVNKIYREFVFQLKEIYLETTLHCSIQFVIKREKNIYKSTKPHPILHNRSNVQQAISFPAIIEYNLQKKSYYECKCNITFELVMQNRQIKALGNLKVDLSKYVNVMVEGASFCKQQFEKCKNLEVQYQIYCKQIDHNASSLFLQEEPQFDFMLSSVRQNPQRSIIDKRINFYQQKYEDLQTKYKKVVNDKQKLELNLIEKQGQLKNAKKSILSSNKQSMNTTQKVNLLQLKMQKKQNSLKQANKKIQSLSQFKKLVKDVQHQNTSLKKRISQTQQILNKKEQECSQKLLQNKKIYQQHDNLRKEYSRVKEDFKEKKNGMIRLQNQLGEYQQTIRKLRSDLDAKDRALQQSLKKNKELKQTISQKVRQIESIIKKNEVLLKSSKDEQIRLKQKLQQTLFSLSDHKYKIDELNQQKLNNNQKISQLTQQKNNQVRNMQFLEQKNMNLIEQNKSYQQLNEELQEVCTKLEKNYDSQMQKAKQVDTTLKGYRDQIKRLEHTVTASSQEQMSLCSLINSKKQEINRLQGIIQELKQKETQLYKQKLKCSNQNSRLCQELSLSQQKITELQQIHQNYLHSSTKNLKNLELNLQQTMQSLSQNTIALNSAKSKIISLQDRQKELVGHVKRSEQSYERIRGEKTRLQSQIKDYEQQIKNLIEMLKAKQLQIYELHLKFDSKAMSEKQLQKNLKRQKQKIIQLQNDHIEQIKLINDQKQILQKQLNQQQTHSRMKDQQMQNEAKTNDLRIQDLRVMIKQKQKSIEQWQNRCQKMSFQIADLHTCLQKKDIQLQQKQEDYMIINQNYHSSQLGMLSLEETVYQKKLENQDLKNKLQKMQAQISLEKQAYRASQNQLHSLQLQFDKKHNQLGKSKSQNSSLSYQIQNLFSKKKQLQTQISSISKQKETLKNQSQKLTQTYKRNQEHLKKQYTLLKKQLNKSSLSLQNQAQQSNNFIKKISLQLQQSQSYVKSLLQKNHANQTYQSGLQNQNKKLKNKISLMEEQREKKWINKENQCIKYLQNLQKQKKLRQQKEFLLKQKQQVILRMVKREEYTRKRIQKVKEQMQREVIKREEKQRLVRELQAKIEQRNMGVGKKQAELKQILKNVDEKFKIEKHELQVQLDICNQNFNKLFGQYKLLKDTQEQKKQIIALYKRQMHYKPLQYHPQNSTVVQLLQNQLKQAKQKLLKQKKQCFKEVSQLRIKLKGLDQQLRMIRGINLQIDSSIELRFYFDKVQGVFNKLFLMNNQLLQIIQKEYLQIPAPLEQHSKKLQLVFQEVKGLQFPVAPISLQIYCKQLQNVDNKSVSEIIYLQESIARQIQKTIKRFRALQKVLHLVEGQVAQIQKALKSIQSKFSNNSQIKKKNDQILELVNLIKNQQLNRRVTSKSHKLQLK